MRLRGRQTILPMRRFNARATSGLARCFRQQLDLIAQGQQPGVALFQALKVMIEERGLPLQPFYDLLSAFSQDVIKARYANFGEVIDYCRRSANPVGRLLLHLYGEAHRVILVCQMPSALPYN